MHFERVRTHIILIVQCTKYCCTPKKKKINNTDQDRGRNYCIIACLYNETDCLSYEKRRFLPKKKYIDHSFLSKIQKLIN